MTCLLLTISLISHSLLADPTILTKGQAAPYDGLLFSQEKASEVKNQLLEIPSFKKSIELYQKNEELYQKKIDTLTVANDKLATTLYDVKDVNIWERVLWFSLGVIATSGAFYGAIQLAK
jgi:hypothetical protein